MMLDGAEKCQLKGPIVVLAPYTFTAVFPRSALAWSARSLPHYEARLRMTQSN
jgi:hypothetical protein